MKLDAQIRTGVGEVELDVWLRVEAGEPLALTGPNGAGKTSVLRVLAGLLPLRDGYLRLDGRALDEPALGVFVPPQRRKVGYVFQDIRLFGHMSVLDNVAFGLRCRGVGRREATAAARRWLERLGVADFSERRADGLSGGESQRVALARALACEPQLLLLDEPLAAVDAATRPELARILSELTSDPRRICVLVTHDPTEARLLAASTLHMTEGRSTCDAPLR